MSMREMFILVFDESVDRSVLINHALSKAGHFDVKTIHQLKGVAREIDLHAPDVVVTDLGNPNRDFPEQMFRLSKSMRQPIASFA
jgi:two-component system, response regulator / RNA-binding antiterminator